MSETYPNASGWCGYAFENICLKHIPQIKNKLGIASVYSVSSSFYKKGTKIEKGTQIDLLIDRNDPEASGLIFLKLNFIIKLFRLIKNMLKSYEIKCLFSKKPLKQKNN